MLPIVNAMLLLANNEWFLRNVMLRMAGYITDKPTTLQIGRFTLYSASATASSSAAAAALASS